MSALAHVILQHTGCALIVLAPTKGHTEDSGRSPQVRTRLTLADVTGVHRLLVSPPIKQCSLLSQSHAQTTQLWCSLKMCVSDNVTHWM